jgi:pimeloyl-ACP methyl ester carboxylesterase
MTILRALFVLFAILSVGNTLRGQQFVWSEWETSAIAKGGPKVSEGLLIYLHGRGAPDVDKLPVLEIFVAMAKLANWDILKINRMPYVDVKSEDDHLLSFVALEVARARQDGYRRVVVAGGSRGGWLALLSATLDGVDGVIGLAPGTIGLEEASLEWQRDELVRRLSQAKASRVAMFLFEGDPREKVPRGNATRQALQGTQAAFIVVDRPPDLEGHSAGASGRFTRRYRDCLLQFMRADDVRPGEVQCPTDRGYAVGSDIGLPAGNPSVKASTSANEAFAPYVGRWQGDDIFGAYMIMEVTEIQAEQVVVLVGQSPEPGNRRSKPWFRELTFKFDETGERLRCNPWPSQLVFLSLRSPTELDVEVSSESGKPSRRITLRRP